MAGRESSDKMDGPNQTQAVSITVFFPCYNEEDNVEATVSKAVVTLENINADYEILIVNDGSSDSTDSIADKLASQNSKIKAIHHPTNLGYGAALQSGFKGATKELVFYTDGDGQFDISEMPGLLDQVKEYDIVSCFRINRQDNIIRRINGYCWTKLVCILFRLKVRDIDCAFKLYKTKIFDNIKLCSSGALIDAEILARAAGKGYTIGQKGVHHLPRIAGEQTGAKISVIFKAFIELFQLYRTIKKEQKQCNADDLI
ncbi:MAG: glycosyltransferase family 2 protein [Planctomycetota bacterium]|jgi:glycosyltransferase involved in cell wall biosynthesis